MFHSPYACWLRGTRRLAVFFIVVQSVIISVGQCQETENTLELSRSIDLQYFPDANEIATQVYFRPIFEGELQEVVFKNEPEFPGDAIWRGAFETEGETLPFLPFAWDETSGVLHVDFNRNYDLTDDVQGPFRFSPDAGEIKLNWTVEQEGLRLAYHGSATFWRTPELWAFFHISSGWKGEVKLDGYPFEVFVIENGDGILDSGDRLYLNRVEAPEAYDNIPLPRHIWLRNERLSAEWAFVPGAKEDDEADSPPALRLVLAQDRGETGIVRFDQRHVQELVLTGTGLIVRDQPEAKAEIPAGEYTLERLGLDGGMSFQLGMEPPEVPSLVVTPQQETLFPWGMPLQTVTTAEREGRNIQISFAMKGAGGERYGTNLSQAPEFVLTQGGKVLVSDKFQFG
jgi:hypothetical protein